MSGSHRDILRPLGTSYSPTFVDTTLLPERISKFSKKTSFHDEPTPYPTGSSKIFVHYLVLTEQPVQLSKLKC